MKNAVMERVIVAVSPCKEPFPRSFKMKRGHPKKDQERNGERAKRAVPAGRRGSQEAPWKREGVGRAPYYLGGTLADETEFIRETEVVRNGLANIWQTFSVLLRRRVNRQGR